MKVIRLGSSGKGYGGNIYESYIDAVLGENFDYEVVNYQFRLKGFFRLLEVPFFFAFCWKYAQNKDFFLIRNFNSAFFPMSHPHQGITIVYHVDETGSSFLVGCYQKLLEKLFFRKAFQNETVVVIAKYWQEFMAQKGFSKVELIYCPYEMEKYQISSEKVRAFQKQHGLEKGPVIYLGNPQPKKGYIRALEVLKDKPYVLVTSGEGQVELPTRHLKLPFLEYLTLLKSVDVVVTMSLFKEGWCRVAHEALLLGTPVIGSGLGGMRELLENGGGIVCSDFSQLPQLIDQCLQERERKNINQDYLRSFTVEEFQGQWQKLLAKMGVRKSGTSK